MFHNRRLHEITGKDNLAVFSYSGRVKSPEWRWQQRRADLRHFEIFRHRPIIIYTRLPAGGTCYLLCTFPASSERLIGISDVFFAFCLRVSVIFPTCSLYPNKSVPTLRYTRRHGLIHTGPCPKALTECSPLDFRISSTVRDSITRQCPQTTIFEEKGQPKQIRTEVPLLTTLTPYR